MSYILQTRVVFRSFFIMQRSSYDLCTFPLFYISIKLSSSISCWNWCVVAEKHFCIWSAMPLLISYLLSFFTYLATQSATLSFCMSMSIINNGLNGVLITQLSGDVQLGHPTQKAFCHIIILLKIFIQAICRYTPLKIWRKAD